MAKQVKVTLSDEVYAQFEHMARSYGLSTATMLRAYLSWHLSQQFSDENMETPFGTKGTEWYQDFKFPIPKGSDFEKNTEKGGFPQLGPNGTAPNLQEYLNEDFDL